MARPMRKRNGDASNIGVDFHPHAAGIDCGATEHYVAIGHDDPETDVRRFSTFTGQLHELADWLIDCGIETVAMESTGVYWMPVYEILERRGLDVQLVEPGKIKNAPGRKTDVCDAQWIQQLHACGLLEGSFLPPEPIAVLRTYVRQKEMLVKSSSQHIQHMQKALMQMNLQLHHVLSDITGQTGQRIIEAILAGQRDPHQLAALRDRRCRNDVETIAAALEGHWRQDYLFTLKQAWDLYHEYQRQIAVVDERISACLSQFEEKSDTTQPPASSSRETAAERAIREHLQRITGVDVTTIDGIGPVVALGVVAEVGTDMSAWSNEKKFSSWLCLCPGNHKTGGRQQRGKAKTRTSANRAAQLFRMAAYSLIRSHSALGAYIRRLRSRLGPAKAITATAHKIAKIFYNMLKYGKEYVDRGEQYYDRQYRHRTIRNLERRAAALGLELVPKPST